MDMHVRRKDASVSNQDGFRSACRCGSWKLISDSCSDSTGSQNILSIRRRERER